MVDAARPVSEYVVPLTPLAIWLPLPAVKPLVVLRKMLYDTPLVVLAVQLRLIWLLETAAAPKLVGGFGGGGGGPVVP